MTVNDQRLRDPGSATGRQILAAVIASLALVLASCASGDNGSEGVAAERGEASSQRDIVAAFYPLVFVAEQVGGEHVTVSDLTPPGAESHDLEIPPRDVAKLQEADLIVYLANFAPALDEAIQPIAAEYVFDVAPSARLIQEGEDHDELDEGGVDPHFWLDPIRLADVADATAARFAELDPDNTESFQRNAASLRAQLEHLDDEFRQGLADCARVDLVTAHRSFGYLANRYGLNQIGIAGLSPEQEPSAGQLALVADFVQDNEVTVIYYESLVDPGVAQAVANETGAATDVLDPLETLSETAAGDDYFQVMRTNLAALRSGLGCA